MHVLAAAGLRALAFDQRGYSPGARPLAVEDSDLVHLASDVLAFAFERTQRRDSRSRALRCGVCFSPIQPVTKHNKEKCLGLQCA
jgi:hypothetical protein